MSLDTVCTSGFVIFKYKEIGQRCHLALEELDGALEWLPAHWTLLEASSALHAEARVAAVQQHAIHRALEADLAAVVRIGRSWSRCHSPSGGCCCCCCCIFCLDFVREVLHDHRQVVVLQLAL